MDAISVYLKNSIESYRLVINLPNKIDLKRSDHCIIKSQYLLYMEQYKKII